MADMEEDISPEEKARIVHDFITYTPPGEINDVVRDVRLLLNDDSQCHRESIMSAVSKFHQLQFTPVKVSDDSCLITSHAHIDGGRFLHPNLKSSFRYDFMNRTADDIQPLSCDDVDEKVEKWRQELDSAIQRYVKEFYPDGVATVYGKSQGGAIELVACIEDHKFQPHNFWNGKWRSEWKLVVDGSSVAVTGVLKTQVHYYEDGNVQLVSQKECKENLSASSEKQLADDVKKVISTFERDYQAAIIENYHSMSSTTFKALRRQLPVTRTKIDWNKILGYQIGKEIGS